MPTDHAARLDEVSDPEPDPEHRVLSPSVSRAVRVIERLSLGPSTLTELSKQLEIPKSSLHSILATLSAHNWIEVSGRELRQGKALFRTVVRYSRNVLLRPTFLEVGRRIVSETGETTFLGILEGNHVLHVARVDGTASLRYVALEGELGPAHASALGKVLLAEREPGEVATLFGSSTLPPLTPQTVTDLNQLLDDLSSVRSQGFALDLGEVVDGLYCVAAPVRDASGAAIASMALAAPAFRFSEHREEYIGLIRKASGEVSVRLGYLGNTQG
ncbi:MAG: IclR family transcriptional regulator [Anaerolineae bacterium]|nr:IclR family transcriptional regulator [Anaerolineae bacterium]MEB2287864.1 IclR family transcriptional regulator [Anaerolineae bacterium]